MNIVMIGSGYVGLVSGTCFSELGETVTCIDTDKAKIARLDAGDIPVYEPGLDDLIERNVRRGRLRFTTDYTANIGNADLIFITVGTPSRDGDGYADLSFVYRVAQQLAGCLCGYSIVVNKSTVPVGTMRRIKRIIEETNPDADFDIASNPEFLREGTAISDFMHPDRIVIGVESDRARSRLYQLYRPFKRAETPIITTNLESAELIKYASNAFLATKVSFINEMATLCEIVHADVRDIVQGMGSDSRIGHKFLSPGPGYGGSCFPKDTLALTRIAREHGVSCEIVQSAIDANLTQRNRMIDKIRNALGGSEAGRLIAVLGLTFKSDTNDMRNAPALTILPALVERGARIRATDPQGIAEAKTYLADTIEYTDDIYETLDDADAVVILTEWSAYRDLDLEEVKRRMKGRVFIDLRNLYEPDHLHSLGFEYTGIGRKAESGTVGRESQEHPTPNREVA